MNKPISTAERRFLFHLSERQLVERAIVAARPRKTGKHPRWVAIRETFGCGSTVAENICKEYGFDPEEMLHGPDSPLWMEEENETSG